jgi:two-component system chemotaxis sensor kinase CheA
MNNQDEAFLERLRATFRVEAEEHLKALSDELLNLEKKTAPADRQEKIERIFREAHSLKGAARSVNHQTIQSICQVLEDVLSEWKQNKITTTPSFFDALHSTIDVIASELSGESNPVKINDLVSRLTAISKLEDQEIISQVDVEKPEEIKRHSEIQKPQEIKPLTEIEKPEPVKENTSQNSGGTSKTIRISLPKLDNLFQEVEELLMVKLTAQQELNELKNLFGSLGKTEKELGRFIADTQLKRQGNTHDLEFLKKTNVFYEKHQSQIKSIHEGLSKILKGSELNVHFVGTMVDSLLEDMKKILMQPVSTLYESFPRMVRDISRELGKEIQLELNGGEIEVDRRILEELKDPIIHIIRNAMDHGIESASERTKKNKNPNGKITISATESHGSSVEISISDDGRGMNLTKLKETALQKKIISAKEATEMSVEDTIKLAFQSGMSTSPIITDISGRGIGLGVVTEKVDKLGGRLNVESIPDKGTTFKLNLPLTMATFRGVHITVEGEDFIMPAHNVQRVIRINEKDIKTVESFETLTVNDHSLSFLRLADFRN